MTFQDLLYMHGFANVEWLISKEIYLLLSKIFQKDIFEEVIKYCYKTYSPLTNDNIPNIDNTLLLVILGGKDLLVFKPKMGNDGLVSGYVLYYLDDCNKSCWIDLQNHKISVYFGNYLKARSYKKIVVYKYHEINEIRSDKEKIRKLIKEKMLEDKKHLLYYSSTNN